MSAHYSPTVDTARNYYNSEDADNFYAMIWGGEDIHIGLYQSPDESITAASHRTVQHMADKLDLKPTSKLLDIGAGYGGAARYIVARFGCKVTALNLSEKENGRARQLNKQAGLDGQIDVVDGSFETIPAPDACFDAVWSQDAILHSGQRQQVVKEVARVLKPGGHFIFTDPMQSDNCPEGVLEPILGRIHLDSLGSPGFYRSTADELGMQLLEFEELTPQLTQHYTRVLEETVKRQAELEKTVDAAYLERMKTGLGHWIEGGKQGYLAWGIFVFQKPA